MDQSVKNELSVSVIIPTFNYGRFISHAIQSALDQTYKIVEVVVVDDGSTDGTEKHVRSFGNIVRYVRQDNAGVGVARNNGVKNSTGDLIAFLDADDLWLPNKIGLQVARFISDNEIGLVHCGMREFDSETGATIKMHFEGDEGWVAEGLLLFERSVVNVSGSSIMVSRDAFLSAGGFDHNIKNGEDWEFCLRVAKKYKVGFVPEPLVEYRNHGLNAHFNVREMERSNLIAWAKAFETEDERFLRLRRRSYGNLHKILAGSYLYNKDYVGFARNLVKSIWFRPSYITFYLGRLMRRRLSKV